MRNSIDEIKSLINRVDTEGGSFIPYKIIRNISELLLSTNELKMLEYHYSLLKIDADSAFVYNIFESFEKRPKEIIEPFLLNKLYIEYDSSLKGDAIQLLGVIGSLKVLPYVRKNLKSNIQDIRNRCLIVVGWLGNEKDLLILNDRLVNEKDNELRGLVATAMRSLWLDNKITAEEVLPLLASALLKEDDQSTLAKIIIVIQDLLNRKFGLQERIDEGIIKGDVIKAKIIKTLDL